MPLKLKITERIQSPNGDGALYFSAAGTFSGKGPKGQVEGEVQALIRQQGDRVELVNESKIYPTKIMGEEVAALWGATGISGQAELKPGRSLTFKKIWYKPKSKR